MRRLFYWFLPVTVAVVAVAFLAYGFAVGMSGTAGKVVADAAEEPPQVSRKSSGPLRVVVFGDSIARGTGDPSGLGIAGHLDRELAARRIAHEATVTFGINGARTADLLTQLDSRNVQQILNAADVIVISIGANDLTRELRGEIDASGSEQTINLVLNRIVKVVDAVRDANPSARIYLLGLYNPFAATRFGDAATAAVNQWNARLGSEMIERRGTVVLQVSDIFAFNDRLSADRYHPSAAGYEIIARRIADSL